MTFDRYKVFNIFLVFLISVVFGIVVLIYFSNRSILTRLNQYKSTSALEAYSKIDETSKNTALILGGDVMLGRTVMVKSKENSDYNYPFREITEYLKNADLTLINLENPIVENCPDHFDGYKFCANHDMLGGLNYSGVDMVNLANNHTYNYGSKGFESTKEFLEKKNIDYTGDGKLLVRTVNDLSFGYLGFDFTSEEPNVTDYKLIRDSDKVVDKLIISVHWGVEYTDTPNKFQKAWASELVKSGADIIVGHHPHWVQNIEYYNSDGIVSGGEFEVGKIPVYYSLGNLVFDQMWSEETKRGLLIKLELDYQGKIINEERQRTYMKEWAQPELLIDEGL